MDLYNECVIHIKNKNQEYLQFKKLLKYSDIISHAYSVGVDKDFRTFKPNKTDLELKKYEKNIDNYKSLCKEIGLDYKNIIKAKQAHTKNVIKIEEIKNNGKIDTENETDGLITNKKDIILTTTNADCILLLFFDPVKKVIANTHSGWKGTLQEISVETVNKMKEEYGSNPADIIVCIAPSIRKCHFEVDSDVYQLFYEKFKKLGDIDKFIQEKNGKWYIDTVYINKQILKQAGIKEENIEDSRNLLSM